MTLNPDEGGGAFPVALSLANRLGVMCATLNSFKKRLAVRAYQYINNNIIISIYSPNLTANISHME